MPAVTIGLPFHAERACLGDAIRSVFAQTVTDWELLLVDDGSTDGSLDIARSVRDPRVHVVSDGTRRRLSFRLNQISQLARGELVARLDADDMLHPERLERQLRVLSEQPSVDLVSTAMANIRADGELLSIAGDGPLRADPRSVLRRGLLSHGTMTARRAWMLANPYSEQYPRAEDHDLFVRTYGTVRVEHLNEALYLLRYRKEAEGMLRDYIATRRDNRRVIRKHGRPMVGRLALAPILAESFAKEAVFRVVTALGRQGALIARRGRPPTAAERHEAADALRRIRETRVPGMDST